jgi:hypothetical protein
MKDRQRPRLIWVNDVLDALDFTEPPAESRMVRNEIGCPWDECETEDVAWPRPQPGFEPECLYGEGILLPDAFARFPVIK